MKNKTKSYLSLIIWIALLLLVGAIIGNITKTSVDTWYKTLNKSPLNPPNYLFSIVWGILYAMIAISGWIIWYTNSFTGLKTIKQLYVVQLVLNWSWTPLFFSYRLIGASLICLCAIIIAVTLLIIKTYKKINPAFLLLTPYLLWLLFAAYLNFYIWQHN